MIQKHLRAAQSRQKSYADQRRRPLDFQVGDYVYLRVSPMKGIHRFGVKGKLAPRYIGPFQVIEQCGPVAYCLDLLTNLSAVHDVFHVSQLRKCLRAPQQVIEVLDVQIGPDLTYQEYPVQVLDQKERSTQHRTIKFYKIQWSNHNEDETTWESEDYLQATYPDFLSAL